MADASAVQTPEPSALPVEPLLRTLSPALRQLGGSLRAWLELPHRFHLSTLARATLEGLAQDLTRQAEALDLDKPLLIVLLMGGTGVGKSTLLNALAGGAIAQTSFARPTTRDPIAYFHETVRPERLDPQLQLCRLAPHDRPALEQKVIVDTPDLDSNDLSNREKLKQLLPVADVILYVGSQEKYHDKLGWQIFLDQRKRKAFAFILNKWDRCLHGLTSGLRPDEDLLRDLRGEGFQNPMLFRTCAQHWVNRMQGDGQAEAPAGEQFLDLVGWLEMGLSRLEIEAIKARGVGQLLDHLDRALATAAPPDLAEAAAKVRASWEKLLAEEATSTADVLLNTLDPYQQEIEHHFTVEGQRRFRGFMAAYLHAFTRLKYFGSTLRDQIPFLPKPVERVETPTKWDLSAFTRACSVVAGERHLDARGRALANRLLVSADQQGFPLSLLSDATESAARVDWRRRFAQVLLEVLQQVEQQWARPVGGRRRWLQTITVILCDWLPPIALLAGFIRLLWRFFMEEGYVLQWFDFVVPVLVLLVVLMSLHLLIVLFLPLRWPAIRSDFRRRIEDRLHEELAGAYGAIPADVAAGLESEQRQIAQLRKEVQEVAHWLQQREQAASIAGLYGTE